MRFLFSTIFMNKAVLATDAILVSEDESFELGGGKVFELNYFQVGRSGNIGCDAEKKPLIYAFTRFGKRVPRIIYG